MRQDSRRSEDADELAATVLTLMAMLAQLRARMRLMEVFLDQEVPAFDSERYRRFVDQHLEEVQIAIEERTREVIRHTHTVALAEVRTFLASLSRDLPAMDSRSIPPDPGDAATDSRSYAGSSGGG